MQARTLALILALPAVASAQIAGHSSVPSSGPAARERAATPPRESDAVLARVEQLRRDLDQIGKRYKKMTGGERQARARELLVALDELQARVERLKEGAASRD